MKNYNRMVNRVLGSLHKDIELGLARASRQQPLSEAIAGALKKKGWIHSCQLGRDFKITFTLDDSYTARDRLKYRAAEILENVGDVYSVSDGLRIESECGTSSCRVVFGEVE